MARIAVVYNVPHLHNIMPLTLNCVMLHFQHGLSTVKLLILIEHFAVTKPCLVDTNVCSTVDLSVQLKTLSQWRLL